MTPTEARSRDLLRHEFAGKARWASQLERDLLDLARWNRLNQLVVERHRTRRSPVVGVGDLQELAEPLERAQRGGETEGTLWEPAGSLELRS